MLIIIILFVSILQLFCTPVLALVDPLSVPNNKVGVHILFPDELHKASTIVNNHGQSSWGYVTVPIQAGDRNRSKWQKFFRDCLEEKIIPIVRLASVPNGSDWNIPDVYEITDFANFLNELDWPTHNRYIIIYNEVNRADEFGGQANPERYADLLVSAVDIFKSRSDNFFILPAGLDNASITGRGNLHWRHFLKRMYHHQPEVFHKIDGWTSHAYPNPDFSSRPDLSGTNKINSYRFDLAYLQNFTKKKLPVFITETGWSNRYLTDSQIGYYYRHAFGKVWSDPNIVAITPFLLNAQDGPFKQFSHITDNGHSKIFTQIMSEYASVGHPQLAVQATATALIADESASPSSSVHNTKPMDTLEKIYNELKRFLGIQSL